MSDYPNQRESSPRLPQREEAPAPTEAPSETSNRVARPSLAKKKASTPAFTEGDIQATLDKVITAFTEACGEPIHYANGNLQYSCPSHGDDRPSLSVKEGDTGVLVHCHAGCEVEDITEAVGLSMADLFYNQAPKKDGPLREVSRHTYEYRYANGSPAGTTTRIDLVDGNGGRAKRFECALDKVDGKVSSKLVYGAERINDARRNGRLVWVVEGEACVDALTTVNEVAVSLPNGSGSASDAARVRELANLLSGCRVVLCPDNDKAGRAWTKNLEEGLSHLYPTKVIDRRFVGGDDGFDIADFIKAKPNIDDVRSVIQADSHLERRPSEAAPIKRIVWAMDSWFPCGALTLVGAQPNVGKTKMMVRLASELTKGDLPGEFLGEPRHIAWVSLEEDENKVRLDFLAAEANMDFVHIVSLSTNADKSPEWWRKTVRGWEEPALVVIDPLAALLDEENGVSDKKVRRAMTRLVESLQDPGATRCAIVGIKHFRKASNSEMLDLDPNQLFAGSLAGNIGFARSAVVVYEQEVNGELIVSGQVTKANLTAKGDGHSIHGRILGKDIPVSDGVANVGVYVIDPNIEGATSWQEVQEKKAQRSGTPELDEAVEEVKDRLHTDGWVRSSEVDAIMKSANLISEGADEAIIHTIRKKVRRKVGGVKAAKSGKLWVWFDPERMTDIQAREAERMDSEAPEPEEVAEAS